jgi:uncharacterized paraquat-inducible protein A
LSKLQLLSWRETVKALAKTLAASTTMAATILILQQMFYDKNLLLLYVFLGAAIYIALIRISRTMDHEDYQLLKQIIGEKPAKYAMKILCDTSTSNQDNQQNYVEKGVNTL